MNNLTGFQFLRWKSFCEFLKYYLFRKWIRKRKKRLPNMINNVRLGGTDRRYRKRGGNG